ncbi:DUF2510 domain-containing protein [Microbacterium aurantiacum]|uniref:DUF2510 domain-containing protein n=1 Tax=Microbacterium aurantiacum TaxID=162393 RepID=A0ABT8FRX7_9MICO|nr:DUF2510 domain-containing protein [Microbacterium aurantiacum]MBN9201813.1 DUF2510 domain-containing protein [Microbacterium chocolatum]MDN4464068.1 DUF2510 domain-containing protein [Microbacterium aurantiacum]ODT10425.1 MAG: hypothetical protein ABS61_08580 [Microbacterium sp. SCN 70-18]
MTATPPGWYDDGHGALRWWDGTQWTTHVAAPDAEGAPDGATPPAPDDATPAAADATDASLQTVGFDPQPVDGAAPPEGYNGEGGGFSAATQPKSKLWILWLVLGVVMLGVVIAAAVLIPLLLVNAATSGGSGGSGGGGAPAGDDEQAAVEVVMDYDDAWQNADCDLFLASTTESFRTAGGLVDCETFEATASEFSASVEDYRIEVTSIEGDAEQILVTTTETFESFFDEEGNPLDEAVTYDNVFLYTLVPADGGWAIDFLE